MKPVVTACMLCILAPGICAAQLPLGTITGIVRDPSNAVIPAAQVKVTNLATGVESTATTTADGTYLIVNLQPGEYLVQQVPPGECFVRGGSP